MSFGIVFDAMLILLIIMAIGFFLYKIGILSDDGNKLLSKLVVYVTNPALIIYSVVSDSSKSDNKQMAINFLVLGLSFILLFIIARVLAFIFRLKGQDSKTYQAMLSFANIGFMGIPLMTAIYGSGIMIYIAVALILFNIFVYSYGIILMNPKMEKLSFKKILNPGVIASLIALLLYVFNVRLPKVPLEVLKYTSNFTTPAAMLTIGATIASYSLLETFKDYKIYIFTFFKLLVMPTVMWLIFKGYVKDELLLGVLVIITGMPVGSTVTMLATEYGSDIDVVSRGTCITTLLSVITIPLITYLLL